MDRNQRIMLLVAVVAIVVLIVFVATWDIADHVGFRNPSAMT